MTLTLTANQRIQVPHAVQRRALALYLVSGSAVWGWLPTTAAADVIGAELVTDPAFDAPDATAWTRTGWDLSGTSFTPSALGEHLLYQTVNLPAGEYVIAWNVASGALSGAALLEIGVQPDTPSSRVPFLRKGSTVSGAGSGRYIHRGGNLRIYAELTKDAGWTVPVLLESLSIKQLTSSAGIPIPLASQLTFTAGDKGSAFAAPLYLAAGAGGAVVNYVYLN